jgi:hypothetical protein
MCLIWKHLLEGFVPDDRMIVRKMIKVSREYLNLTSCSKHGISHVQNVSTLLELRQREGQCLNPSPQGLWL